MVAFVGSDWLAFLEAGVKRLPLATPARPGQQQRASTARAWETCLGLFNLLRVLFDVYEMLRVHIRM